jgi:hypothetical protein
MDNKIKSKIFAAYIGSKVELCQSRFSEDSEDRVFTLFGVTKDDWFMVEESKLVYHFKDSNNDSLLLTSLSNISDDDLNFLSEILEVIYPENFVNSIVENSSYGANPTNCISATDFLRSKGYALPYMGYSVEDLVKEGIYTLKD